MIYSMKINIKILKVLSSLKKNFKNRVLLTDRPIRSRLFFVTCNEESEHCTLAQSDKLKRKRKICSLQSK